MIARQPAFDLAGDDERRCARHDMRVAFLVDEVVVADRAAAARAVVDNQRHRRPFVLVDDAGDHAHQVVGAAAGRVRHDNFNGALRILRLRHYRAR